METTRRLPGRQQPTVGQSAAFSFRELLWLVLTPARPPARLSYSECMEGLHPALLASLDRLPGDRGVVLLTRHSIREEPPGGFAGYDVPLTPAGVALARNWGAALRRPLHTVLSSPVGRCVDTAQAMVEGAAASLPVDRHHLLVEPGSFVHDLGAVGRLFLELGVVGFANRHLAGELAEGVLSPEEGTARVIALARAHIGPPGTMSLLVTHDTILAAVIHTLRAAKSIGEEEWPRMMEGAFFWFDDEQVYWLWRGEAGCRPLAGPSGLGSGPVPT